MKALIVLLGLLAWIGCHEESSDIHQQVYEADASWTNMLATDGCSWHFSIAHKDSMMTLLPSKATREKIDKELGQIESAYSSTPVRIKYTLTGNKATVPCGWGRTGTYDEIDVIEIRKK